MNPFNPFNAHAKALQNPTLFVRNLEQAALWLELDGQISDGHWENARPYDHYKVWCNAQVVVAPAGQPVGRTFPVMKDSYNFTSRELLDVVRLRMLSVVRIARACGLEVAAALEHAPGCADGRIDWSREWNKSRAVGVTAAQVDAAIADETYGMSDMLKDLRELKAIIKVRVEDKR